MIFRAKTGSNPENVVGLMTMAGRSPEVLVTPTQEHGKVLAALHTVKLTGEPDMATGINVAQLALKHRQNKNQRQRIIVFVGSPLESPSLSQDALVKLAKKMKKNNVAIDIVSFGDASGFDERLQAMIENVNSSDNSRFISVPAGAGLMSDHIVSAGLLSEDSPGGGPAAGPSGTANAGSGGDEDGFGVDPNLDPELAMALRMSLEEERARQAATTGNAAQPSLETIAESSNAAAATSAEAAMDSSATAIGNSASTVLAEPQTPAAGTTSGPTELDAHAHTPNARPAPIEVPAAAGGIADQDEDMDDELARAIALSQQDEGGESAGMDVDDEDDEEAALARAIAMSMDEAKDEKKK